MATEKALVPAYVSPRSMETFFTQRREDGHVTDVVDKSLMSNFSGSTINELTSALKYLRLIGPNGEPSDAYREYVLADDDKRKALMRAILQSAYAFVFGAINIERATTDQVVKLFREQGANGSTLVRGMGFFIYMAKFAEIKLSPNLKVPSGMRSGTPRPKKELKLVATSTAQQQVSGDTDDEAETPEQPGSQVFYIPIPIDRRVKIVIPADWAPNDWDRFTKMLDLYVEGWKELAAMKHGQKDKGPTPQKE